MLDKELKILRETPGLITAYLDAMSALQRTGIISFLRAWGRVSYGRKSTVEEVALEGARAAGFQECLDLLFNFEEKFLRPTPTMNAVPVDYGGLTQAVRKGDLTKEEADAIRARSADTYTKSHKH